MHLDTPQTKRTNKFVSSLYYLHVFYVLMRMTKERSFNLRK